MTRRAVPHAETLGRVADGARLRAIRTGLGLTLAELAAEAGIAVARASDAERGLERPRAEHLAALARLQAGGQSSGCSTS